MPIYDYDCESCGPFRETRPMAKSDEPCECPECGEPSSRAFFVMPAFACMDVSKRSALATNERASHEPALSGSERGRRLHPSNCSCCRPGAKTRATLLRPDGAKSFPTARPWMISH